MKRTEIYLEFHQLLLPGGKLDSYKTQSGHGTSLSAGRGFSADIGITSARSLSGLLGGAKESTQT
jgi:hypothetical protein